MRVDEALRLLPCIRRRLGSPTSNERGAITGNLSLQSVHRGNVVLVGDASGAVDAITGEGLCLALRQGIHLAAAIASNDVSFYARMHRKLARPPRAMAHVLLFLARNPTLRHAAIRLLNANSAAFQALLAAHAGEEHLRQGVREPHA